MMITVLDPVVRWIVKPPKPSLLLVSNEQSEAIGVLAFGPVLV